MPNYSKTTIIGHTGRDTEMRYFPDGTPVANISVAVTDKWKDKTGARQEQTTWYRCQLTGPQAEVAEQYVKKGDPVLVEGKMQERKWTDKQGQERFTWELRAERIVLLGQRSASTSEEASEQPAPKAKPGPNAALIDMENDRPF